MHGSPPPAALPKLVDLLRKTVDSSERQAYVRVIGKYGPLARPYVDEIEEVRDKETDPTTRSNVEAAAAAIRAGQNARIRKIGSAKKERKRGQVRMALT
jgi:hypothetical protein